MAKTLRHEIPESGERYDMTFIKAGKNDDGRMIAVFKIDNGDYAGHTVSAPTMEEWVRRWKRGETRRSARVKTSWHADLPREGWSPVEEGHTGADRYRITYALEDFGEPEAPAEVRIRQTPNKFKRRFNG